MHAKPFDFIDNSNATHKCFFLRCLPGISERNITLQSNRLKVNSQYQEPKCYPSHSLLLLRKTTTS